MVTQISHTLEKPRHLFVLPGSGRVRANEPPRRRIYHGEEAGARITRWLNGHLRAGHGCSAASRRRISDLLDNLLEVLEVMEQVDADFDWMNSPEPERFREITTELAARLDEYPTVPAFSTEYHGKQWTIEDAVAGRRPSGESVAAHAIIELAKQNLLNRIGMCHCGKWYFARFFHQHCCSVSCRRNLYEKTPEFREKRRTYMRRYYRLKTSGKVK